MGSQVHGVHPFEAELTHLLDSNSAKIVLSWSLVLFVPMADLRSHIPTDCPPYTNIDTGGQTESREQIYALPGAQRPRSVM